MKKTLDEQKNTRGYWSRRSYGWAYTKDAIIVFFGVKVSSVVCRLRYSDWKEQWVAHFPKSVSKYTQRTLEEVSRKLQELNNGKM